MRDYDIESDCFNPCFIGTYSFTFYSYNTVWKIRIWVLILVLLELILLLRGKVNFEKAKRQF